MKKLLCLFLALCCMLCAFGCQGKSPYASKLQKFEITGEEVSPETINNMVQSRKSAFIENDRQNKKDKHYFEIEIKLATEAVNRDIDMKVDYEVNGKLVLDFSNSSALESKLEMAFDLDIKIKMESSYEDESGKRVKSVATMEGSLICVDGVNYTALEVEEKVDGEEKTQSIKVKAALEELIKNDLIDVDIEEIFNITNNEYVELYGADISAFLKELSEIENVRYYVDGDNVFFAEIKNEELMPSGEIDTDMQYKIRFAANSAVLEEEMLFMQEHTCIYADGANEKATYDEIAKIYAHTQRISYVIIREQLDSDQYQDTYF